MSDDTLCDDCCKREAVFAVEWEDVYHLGGFRDPKGRHVFCERCLDIAFSAARRDKRRYVAFPLHEYKGEEQLEEALELARAEIKRLKGELDINLPEVARGFVTHYSNDFAPELPCVEFSDNRVPDGWNYDDSVLIIRLPKVTP